jgi:hypothetical protein
MNHWWRTLRRGGALALAVLVAACGSSPHPKSNPPPARVSAPVEAEAIAALLDTGNRKDAKKRLAAALKRDPRDPTLMLLRDSMDRDPTELLGPNSYPYTIRQGDTIAGLAERLLGNRLKSHQLARYNKIEGAALLTPGQVLRIPGQQPRPEPVRRVEKPAEPQPAPARPKPAAAAARPAAPASTVAPRASVAAARQARSAGLAALNEGNPARAVGLLSRAAALDPGNPVIARDLQRAQRINATVKARQ